MDSVIVRDKKLNLKQLLSTIIKEHPLLKDRFKNARMEGDINGWGLPKSSEVGMVCGDRWLLLGDAASLVEPFSGEGIGNAMISGMLAGNALKKAFEDKDFSKDFFYQYYQQELDKMLGASLKMSQKLQNLMVKYPKIFNILFTKMAKSNALKETILGIIGRTKSKKA